MIYIYIYTHVYTYIYIYVYTYIYMYVYIITYITIIIIVIKYYYYFIMLYIYTRTCICICIRFTGTWWDMGQWNLKGKQWDSEAAKHTTTVDPSKASGDTMMAIIRAGNWKPESLYIQYLPIIYIMILCMCMGLSSNSLFFVPTVWDCLVSA